MAPSTLVHDTKSEGQGTLRQQLGSPFPQHQQTRTASDVHFGPGVSRLREQERVGEIDSDYVTAELGKMTQIGELADEF